MGALYRVDPAVQKGMLGMKPPELDEQTAFRSGLGGVRWFEGWPVRRRDSRGDGTVRPPLHVCTCQSSQCSVHCRALVHYLVVAMPRDDLRGVGVLPSATHAGSCVQAHELGAFERYVMAWLEPRC